MIVRSILLMVRDGKLSFCDGKINSLQIVCDGKFSLCDGKINTSKSV